jgi:hypothetical protein
VEAINKYEISAHNFTEFIYMYTVDDHLYDCGEEMYSMYELSTEIKVLEYIEVHGYNGYACTFSKEVDAIFSDYIAFLEGKNNNYFSIEFPENLKNKE